MCRDNNHGGRRCPHDTSEKRQARRLAERSRNQAVQAPLRHGSDVWEQIPNPPHYSDLAGIQREIEALQTLIREQDPTLTGADQVTIDQWDQDVEARLTTLGKVLGARAESLIGFRANEFEETLERRAAELYNPLTRRNDELRTEENEIWDGLEPLIERIADNNQSTPMWRYRNWDKSDFYEQAPEYLREEDKELLDRLEEMQKALATNKGLYAAADATYNRERQEAYEESRKRLTKAYQQVIGELREVGGTIELNDTGFTQNYGVEDMLTQTAGQHYPRAWIEAHNTFDGPRMVVVPAGNRPNFEEQGGYVSDRGRHHVEVPQMQQYVLTLKTEDPETLAMINAVMPSEARVGSVKHYTGDAAVAVIPLAMFEIGGDDESQRPDGEGWEFKSSIQGIAAEFTTPSLEDAILGGVDVVDRQRVESIVKPRWYRPSTERQRNAPVLRIFERGDLADVKNDTSETSEQAVAYHEFGHRVEQVLPHNMLPRQQRAFLMRRANKIGLDRDDQLEDLDLIRPGEFAHANTGMVDIYMSRDYFRDNHYEVFTTGIEALYGQAYGGLVGHSLRNATKDYEHRGFVLGALAVL